METALKFESVDSFFVDEPMVPLPTNDGMNKFALNSPSFRRYSYSRMPPVTWLEWSLKAYTGVETSPEDEKDLYHGTVSTGVDITGGAISVSEWVERSKKSTLPKLILTTAKGDPLQDGGLAFKEVYSQAIQEVEGKHDTSSDQISAIKHYDTNSGHVGFYFFEPDLFQELMKEWYSEISTVWHSKNPCAAGRNETEPGAQELATESVCTDESSVLQVEILQMQALPRASASRS